MASVFIGDLDDFITPSQACVNPIFAGSANQKPPPQQQAQQQGDGDKGRAKVTLEASWMEEGAGAALEMEVEAAPAPVRPDLIKVKAGQGQGAPAAATVSLNDCLACSGCVTSAETVLISQQSGGEFRRVLARQPPQHAHVRAVVVALAPQTLASLAVRLVERGVAAPSAPLGRVQHCLGAFLRRLAAHHAPAASSSASSTADALPVHVYGTAAASNLSLLESAAEFVARYRHWHQQQEQQEVEGGPTLSRWEAPAPSRALSATRDAAEGEEWGSGAVGGIAAGRPAPVPRHEALPMLASACPGWVCYAEKTTPQALPYISTAKSPQQILGTLVKAVLAPGSGLAPKEVCLVGVMPCYDKKLEASRKDFVHEEWGEAPEVDLVLTTGEILELIVEEHRQGRLPGPPGAPPSPSPSPSPPLLGQQQQQDEEEEAAALAAFWALAGMREQGGEDAMDVDGGGEVQSQPSPSPPSPPSSAGQGPWTLASAESALLLSGLDPEAPGELLLGQVRGGEGGGVSGGFLEFVFRYAARELFGVEVGWEQPLVYHQGRNADYQEVRLELPLPTNTTNSPHQQQQQQQEGETGEKGGGKTVALRFARAYGFRNIQAVMSKLRRGKEKTPLHFVEIMACPSGCVNGGGQLKGPAGEASAASRERVGRVRAALEEGRRPRPPTASALAQWVYGPGGVAGGGPLGAGALRLFHTRYHAVPKLELSNPSVIKW